MTQDERNNMRQLIARARLVAQQQLALYDQLDEALDRAEQEYPPSLKEPTT